MRQFAILTGGSTAVIPIYVLVADLPASGSFDGEIVYVLESRKMYSWNATDLTWTVIAGEGALIGRVNQTAIPNGAQTIAIVFTDAMPDTEYSVMSMVRNTVDTDPIYLQVINTVRATTGFTIEFNAPTDSGNYVLEWAIAGDAKEKV